VKDHVSRGLPFAYYYYYYSFSSSPHKDVLRMQGIFKRLQQWRLCLHYNKCSFFHDCLPYLGHMIFEKLGIKQVIVGTLKNILIIAMEHGFMLFLAWQFTIVIL